MNHGKSSDRESLVSSSLPLHSRVTTDRLRASRPRFSRSSRLAGAEKSSSSFRRVLDTPRSIVRLDSAASRATMTTRHRRRSRGNARVRGQGLTRPLDPRRGCVRAFSIFRISPGAPRPDTWRGASASAVLPTAQASRN